jgi:hypothetical protein
MRFFLQRRGYRQAERVGLHGSPAVDVAVLAPVLELAEALAEQDDSAHAEIDLLRRRR